MSQCSRQPEEMQAGSHQHRKKYETMLERSCGYFAPDVSVVHFAPPCSLDRADFPHREALRTYRAQIRTYREQGKSFSEAQRLALAASA